MPNKRESFEEHKNSIEGFFYKEIDKTLLLVIDTKCDKCQTEENSHILLDGTDTKLIIKCIVCGHDSWFHPLQLLGKIK